MQAKNQTKKGQMEIQIRLLRKINGLSVREIRKKLGTVLKDLDCKGGELSLLFTDDVQISALNSRYLGREGPTNVIAFPMSEETGVDPQSGMLGDIVISVDRAREEAEQTGEHLHETVFRLLVHGLLHLLGYDHERSSREAHHMEKEEKRLLKILLEG